MRTAPVSASSREPGSGVSGTRRIALSPVPPPFRVVVDAEHLPAALAEREHAIAILRCEHDHAIAARDAALAERDAAVAERDAALAELTRLRALRPALEIGSAARVSERDTPGDLDSEYEIVGDSEWEADAFARTQFDVRMHPDTVQEIETTPRSPRFDRLRGSLSLKRVVLSASSAVVPLLPGADRRLEPRLRCEIELEFLDDSHFYAGLTLDVSRGGLFVATYHPLPVGTRLELLLDLGVDEPLEVAGEVRWVRHEAAGGGRPGLGIAFRGLSDTALGLIGAYCDEHAPRYIDDV